MRSASVDELELQPWGSGGGTLFDRNTCRGTGRPEKIEKIDVEPGVGGGDGEGVCAAEVLAGRVDVAAIGTEHYAAVLGTAGDAVGDRVGFGVHRSDGAGDRARRFSGELDRVDRRCLVEEGAPDH